ncbi:2-amino-4-hydroxy-6-hydroxymethyldihydropteridine diphosphokinase [Qipengyuania sp.]|uniref:2-amino-4-hydroxy-6- hydroxymethyldihydropteridine diphosphokinase n=1 Tax=Qipengyuania sp. TaxID=2004515 RepID=UPI0037367CC1
MRPHDGHAGRHVYLVALGSNMRAGGMRPSEVLAFAIGALTGRGFEILAVSPIIASAPLGPSKRRYVNAAAVIAGGFGPLETLGILQSIEQMCGRQRRGQRWRARPLDLDIVLWSGGILNAPQLTIPHPRYAERRFVLDPAARVAPGWRDPVSGRTLRQQALRLRRPRAL